MTALLVPIIFLLVSRLCHLLMNQRKKNWDWRDSVISGYIGISLLFLVTSETLSIFRMLNRSMMILYWSVLLLALLLAVLFLGKKTEPPESRVSWFRQFRLIDWLLLSAVIGIAAAAGVTAFIAPPHDSDVVAYHMGRIMHWIQNQTTANYAVPDARQLWMPPWPAYAQTNLYLLAGSDRLANMIQWAAMVGALLVVSRMACFLGAGIRGQLAAALFAATVPVGIFQASSSFTDYSAATWVAISAWLLLRSIREEPGWFEWIGLGMTAALGYLTKGTFVLFALPFYIWFAALQIKKVRARTWVVRGLIVLFLILLLAAPYWIRNLQSFDSIMGPEAHVDMLSNAKLGVDSLLSNLLRHTAIQFASPSRALNSFLYDFVVNTLASAGIDPFDPDLSYRNARFTVRWLFPGSDSAPIHAVLIVLLLPLMVIFRRFRRKLPLLLYLAAAVGYLLFCSYIRWQPATRFSFSVFLLLAPVVGWISDRVYLRSVSPALLLVMVLYAAPGTLMNRWRPLIGWRPRTASESILTISRHEMFFRDWDPLAPQYEETAAQVLDSGCKNVALRVNSNEHEYYWWVLLEPLKNGIEMEHTLVYPGLEDLINEDFEACAMICTVCSNSANERDGLYPVNPEDDIILFLPLE